MFLGVGISLTLPTAAQPYATVSYAPVVRAGPGSGYRQLGRLPEGAQVTLDYCTTDRRWCLVTGAGWVDASYLVGSSAKIRATPPRFLVDPFARDRDSLFGHSGD